MIYGNRIGDGFQNGGVLVISRRGVGPVLLNHVEEEPGDHVPNIVILNLLEIRPSGPVSKRLSLSRAK